MDKVTRFFLLLERLLPASNLALDLYAKIKPNKNTGEKCPSCKTLLWEGDKPNDWMNKVKQHHCTTDGEKGYDAVCREGEH